MSGEKNVPEKSHAELGASVASRWMNCPGSIRLSRQVPVPPSTSFAEEGTRAHAVAELCLNKDVDPDFFVGMELEGGTVTDEMADFVRVYVDECRMYQRSPLVESHVEQRFNLGSLNPPGPMYGTADFVWWHPESDEMGVIDLKYGAGVVVEVKGNKQLRYYALGALLSLPHGFTPSTINITIVQPRANHPDGVVRSEKITFAELMDFAGELMDAARATQAPDATLHAGSWCRFCPASGVCPEQLKRAQLAAQSDFDVIEEVRPPAPETLTVVQIAEFLPKLVILEDWIASLRAHAAGKLERGEEVPGYKLVAKRATRKWTDEKEVRQFLEAKGYAPEEITVEPKLKSPAQIEKVMGKDKKSLPLTLVSKESSGYKMVPASDPAPAVEVTRGEEFAAIPAITGDE